MLLTVQVLKKASQAWKCFQHRKIGNCFHLFRVGSNTIITYDVAKISNSSHTEMTFDKIDSSSRTFDLNGYLSEDVKITLEVR